MKTYYYVKIENNEVKIDSFEAEEKPKSFFTPSRPLIFLCKTTVTKEEFNRKTSTSKQEAIQKFLIDKEEDIQDLNQRIENLKTLKAKALKLK